MVLWICMDLMSSCLFYLAINMAYKLLRKSSSGLVPMILMTGYQSLFKKMHVTISYVRLSMMMKKILNMRILSMRMLNKKSFMLLSALTVNSILVSPPTFATGIPVFDAASATNMLQQLQAAKQQYDQLVEQYKQAKSLHDQTIAEGKRLYEGVTNFDVNDLLDDPTLSSYLPNKRTADSLLDAADNIGELREKYKLTSSDSEVQKAYDSMLTELNNMQTAYNTAVKRSDHISNLSKKLEQAATPQEKADYQNAINTESNNLLNEKTKLDLAKANFDANFKIAQASRRAEFKEEFSVDK
ncbi:Putative conjugal transfer protein TraF (plasmid) [Escherichia coli Xuzhou21]|nr:Putative conjugal transfer protein TraF [Escherichia coli Xuzhou21]